MQSAQSHATNQGVAFVGAKIYPSPTDKPIIDGVVLVRDGKITGVGNKSSIKIPGDTRVIDCGGLTLTAGFWNSHVHFTEPNGKTRAASRRTACLACIEKMITRYGLYT